MKKRIAIVTGASGGLGKEFVRQMLSENVDEIWAVARNKEKLEGLRAEWGERIVPFAGDLSSPEGVHALCEKLGEQTPVIVYLVNNAGTGRMEEYEKSSVPEIEKTIYLNSTAVAVLSRACIPYMEPGGHIVNVASQAAFQPLPFMTIYAATKAFVRNFTRALNVELQDRKVVATAVCPGWIKTDLLPSFSKGKNPRFPGQVTAASVVVKAMKDAKKGRDMSVNIFLVKCMRFLAAILPQRIVSRAWLWYIRKYVGE